MQMPIITSHYWNMVHGGKTRRCKKRFRKVNNAGTCKKNMAFFLKCKRLDSQAGVQFPKTNNNLCLRIL